MESIGLSTGDAGAADVRKRGVARLLLLAVILIAAVAAVQLSPIGTLVRDVHRARATLDDLGPWAHPACLLASAVLIGCGFPRLALCAAASAILGVGWGLALTQGGALLGYYVVFCFVRWGGGDWVIQRRPR